MNSPISGTRWNPWPVGIIAFFVGFIALTAVFIVFSTGQRSDLVTPDYYEQELRHQEQIDRVQRTQAAHLTATVVYERAGDRLVISLPSEHAVAQPSGRILLYRPAAAAMDGEIALAVDAQGRQVVDARELAAGLWQVQVTWSLGTAEFFSEQRVVINRGEGASP